MKNILSQKIPMIYFFVLLIVSIACTFMITSSYYNLQKSILSANNLDQQFINSTCDYQTKRLDGYNFIKPLLYVDKNCESGVFIPAKQVLIDAIDRYKLAGVLSTASVYVRDFNQGDFISINENTKYKSGSLMKVPLLITYLHKDEDEAGFINTQLLFKHAYPTTKSFDSTDKHLIKEGTKYTIKQLLEYMMINGDNNATSLLYENVDPKYFKKTFTDMGLSEPDGIVTDYQISAKDYSIFMRTLYNATYLTINNSEYATELLCKCESKGGIPTSLPASARMAHRFGEASSASEKQLHESAIIYVNNYPYLITIMTKGADSKKLATIISQLSGIVYKQIIAKG